MNKHISWGMILLLISCCIYIVREILPPFVLSLIIAYIFSPFAQYLDKKLKLNRYVISAICVLIFMVILSVLVTVLVPIAYSQLVKLASLMPKYQEIIYNKVIVNFPDYLKNINPDYADFAHEGLKEILSLAFQNSSSIFYTLWQSSFAILGVLTVIFLVPLISFYLIADWQFLVAGLFKLIPNRKKHSTQTILHNINKALAGFFRGQINVCLILSVYYTISLLVIGMDFSFLIGSITGILSFIPIIGLLGGFIASLTLSYLQFGAWKMLSVVIIFALGNVLESIISSRIMAKYTGLHPVLVVFFVLLGANLYGITGMFLAVPLGTVVMVITQTLLQNYYNSSLYKS